MKFGNPKGKLPVAGTKGIASEMLPHRGALTQLTKGTPMQRSMGNYSKLTPSGAGAPATYEQIIAMGLPKQ